MDSMVSLDPQEAWDEMMGITPSPAEQFIEQEDKISNHIVIGTTCSVAIVVIAVVVIATVI